MYILWTILGVLGGLLLIALLILLLGSATIKISVKHSVKVVFSVGGIRFWLYPLRSDRADSEAEERWIRKQMKKRKQKKKAERAQIAAGKPVPNMLENLQMTVALVKLAHEQVRGRFTIHVHRFHITVGAADAAQTAILYGAVVGITSTFMQWIHSQFAPIERSTKAMSVTPDYVTGQNTADVDIVLKMSLIRALGIISKMFDAYHDEKDKAIMKAARRLNAQKEREKRKEAERKAAANG